MNGGTLIKHTRLQLGITQTELAERLGTTQSSIARLEGTRSNPRLSTLRSALHVMESRLELIARPMLGPGLDRTLIQAHLKLTPLERVRVHDAASRSARRLLAGVKRLPRDA